MNADKLLFSNTHDTIITKENITLLHPGFVGCFGMDGEQCWGLFVVVSVCGLEIHAIAPRIRISKDGVVEFGQDTLTEDAAAALAAVHCQCQLCASYPGMMPAGWSLCEKKNLKAYHDTFIVSPVGTQYKTTNISVPAYEDDHYIFWLAKRNICGQNYQ